MNTSTSSWKLAALAWAATKRGITYGELVTRLTPASEAQIYRRFREYKEREREKQRLEFEARREAKAKKEARKR